MGGLTNKGAREKADRILTAMRMSGLGVEIWSDKAFGLTLLHNSS